MIHDDGDIPDFFKALFKLSMQAGEVFETAQKLSEKFGVKFDGFSIIDIPEVYAHINPFTHKMALSTGLLDRLENHKDKKDILEGIVAHEFKHAATNKDIIDNMKNNFLVAYVGMFLVVEGVLSTIRKEAVLGASEMIIGDQLIHNIKLIAKKQQRTREYKADAGAAEVVGKEKMIKALGFFREADKDMLEKNPLPKTIGNFALRAKLKTDGILKNDEGLMGELNKLVTSLYQLGSTHPLFKNRIKALEKLQSFDVKKNLQENEVTGR